MPVYADITKPPPPLPAIQFTTVRKGLSLLLPLSRRGHGPGLIVLQKAQQDPLAYHDGAPSAMIKWAEEGYTVAQIDSSALETEVDGILKETVSVLSSTEKCQPKGKIGLVAYDPNLWNIIASQLSQVPEIVGSIIYTGVPNLDNLETPEIPILHHVAGQPAASVIRAPSTRYAYPKMKSYAFATHNHDHFHYVTESVSHSRSLQFLKKLMDGPYFDLEAIWDEHTYYEFADRSVEHTMSTMVQEPYVNHVPTLTGGIGREKLTHFYRHNFIFNNSADTDLELISRTIGIDRVIDEFIFKFTHDQEIDWLLPGVPATNIKAEIPFTAVVNFRGDRLYHEHISWDQGTVLKQLGLMPDYLPFPHPVAGASGSHEYRVPVLGIETAMKMRDRHAVESNQMFAYKVKEKET